MCKGIIENEIKDEIKSDLLKLQDLKYMEFNKNLCPDSKREMIGIRIPVIREYAKNILKKYEIDDILKEIDDQYFEETMLHGILIGSCKGKGITEIIKYCNDFIPKIDNWAVCDSFCTSLKISKKHPVEMWEYINNCVESDYEYEVRFGIVMRIAHYIDEKHIEQNLSILNSIQTDKYYIQMAIAWCIASCLTKFYDITIKYLKSPACTLDDFTYNKSLQKARESFRITKEQKEELLKLKR